MAAISPGAAGGSGGAPSCSDYSSLCQTQKPVCKEGSSVECAPGDDALCGGKRPYCNPETLSCEACRYHAHCPDSACNPFTGACLDATPETVGPGGDHASIAAALGSVGDGEEAVFLVSPTPGDYNETPAPDISSGRTIAFLGQGGRPVVRATDGGAAVTVFNGATLLLEGVDLMANTNAVAMQVAGFVALDRVRISSNN